MDIMAIHHTQIHALASSVLMYVCGTRILHLSIRLAKLNISLKWDRQLAARYRWVKHTNTRRGKGVFAPWKDILEHTRFQKVKPARKKFEIFPGAPAASSVRD